MFGKFKQKADLIWIDSAKCCNSVKFDKELFPDAPGHGVAGVCVALYCFVLVGIFNSEKMMHEMVDRYRAVQTKENGQSLANEIMEDLQDCYANLRFAMINTQDTFGNDYEKQIMTMAIWMADTLGVQKNEIGYNACRGYVETVLNHLNCVMK